MANSTDGKTVQLKELPSEQIRIFRNRDAVTVLFPEEVRASVVGAPVSIDITPMTHREAEHKKRIEKLVGKAETKSVVACGVKYSDYIAFTKEAIETNIKLFKSGDNDGFKLTQTEQAKLQDKFNKKWSKINDLLATKDDTLIWEAQDKVLENSVKIVAGNCKSLNFEDSEPVEVSVNNIDSIHPDLFKWILTQIEKISYLDSGEVLGLQ